MYLLVDIQPMFEIFLKVINFSKNTAIPSSVSNSYNCIQIRLDNQLILVLISAVEKVKLCMLEYHSQTAVLFGPFFKKINVTANLEY